MNKKLFYVANWKMNLSLDQEIEFAKLNKNNFFKLAKDQDIILCSSFISLYPINKLFENSNIKIGAQNCSNKEKGALTGQVSVQSIKESGCKYCIIGHSEVREEQKDTNQNISEKFNLLIKNKITPIICIGENEKENTQNKTFDVLTQELELVFNIIKKNLDKFAQINILIAYEPIWSIGTGSIPKFEYLEKVFDWLFTNTKKISSQINFKLLYGGSVDSLNVIKIKEIKNLDGFLIGGASLSFQEFEKIVKLENN